MHRWTLYLYTVASVALLALGLNRLADHQLLLSFAQGDIHPWVLRAYEFLRGGEVWLFGLLAALLAPFVIGSRKPLEGIIKSIPSSGAIAMASLWHYALLGAGGVLILYISHPWASRLPVNRLDEIVAGWSQLSDLPGRMAVGSWWLVVLLLAPPVLYLMLWRNPDALSHFLRNMLLPALLLADGLALLALANLEDGSWLWSGLAGFFFPITIIWAFLLASIARGPRQGVQVTAFVLLLLLTVPLALLFAAMFHNWNYFSTGTLATVLPVNFPLPSARTLILWSAVAAILLFLILTGVVCRRAEEHAQQIDSYTSRLSLPRLTFHFPRRSYPSLRVDPPRIGFALIDIPLMVLFTLAERLANAALMTAQLLDGLFTLLLDWLLHLVYTLAALIYNFAVFMLVHLVYTLVNLPGLILKALGYLLDSLDIVARHFILPLLACSLAALGLMVTINAAVSYFLVGEGGLLLWGLLGVAALLLGIVVCLSAVAHIAFGDAAYWYILGLVEYLPYPMVLLVLLLWTAIGAGPRFGVTHFHAGIVTWTLSGLILIVLVYGLFFGKKEELSNS